MKSLIRTWCIAFAVPFASFAFGQSSPDKIRSADVIVYGGTSGAITAAIQAKRLGHSVLVVSPDKHLGGLTAGGLGWTDTGNKAVIGGLSREFYHRVWQHYNKPEAWDKQPRESYGNQGQGNPAIDGQQRTMWIFEPHVAEMVFENWVKEEGIEIVREAWLDRSKGGVSKKNQTIESIRTLDGTTYKGKMFLDATYEGDLIDAAGVSFHVGREANALYGEKWNGVQVGVLHHRHHFGIFKQGISPYVVPGDPKSGLLPKISADPPGEYGSADHRVQAYCFRMCLTNHAPNRVPFPKPEGYDAKNYELMRRVLLAGWREGFAKFDPVPNFKTDTNNHGPFSTDNIGMNYDYPTASYERRKEIIEEHRRYQQGLMYFLANDPNIPEDVRKVFAEWGLAKDEFVDNGNWPHQLYIREARRLVGEMVMTEKEILKENPVKDSVGMGSYTIDSHNVQRYVTPEGFVQNEGDIGVSTRGPYPISMRSLMPKKSEASNLLVPVCLSSSHIAFGSIRMEPVFMILGESASTIASLAIRNKTDVQSVSYDEVRPLLLKNGQVLEYEEKLPEDIAVASLKGIVVDNKQATLTGHWASSRSTKPWVGVDYLHDADAKVPESTAEFATKEPLRGRYRVRMAYSAGGNRTRNVAVEIHHAAGVATVTVDQTKAPTEKPWVDLGEFTFNGRSVGKVKITNAGTSGHVVIDAFQWLPVE
ncbi:MAG: FAD-dependent oxidoreductase [Pirellula sp.]|nr:FAD-dependent oxidoreductase [Pirellula sp.]